MTHQFFFSLVNPSTKFVLLRQYWMRTFIGIIKKIVANYLKNCRTQSLC